MARTKDEALTKARRNEILEAAARCFVKRGIHQASMRQICAEAKLSSGAVYNYFQSKDAIIEGMAAREQEDIAELAAFLRQQSDALKAIVQAAVWIVEETSAADARLYTELAAEAGRNDAVRQRMVENDAALQACLLDTIRRGQDSDRITTDLTSEELLSLVTVTYEGFISRIAVEGDAGRKKMAALTAFTLEKLLQPECDQN